VIDDVAVRVIRDVSVAASVSEGAWIDTVGDLVSPERLVLSVSVHDSEPEALLLGGTVRVEVDEDVSDSVDVEV
jgi:hypothetical protein